MHSDSSQDEVAEQPRRLLVEVPIEIALHGPDGTNDAQVLMALGSVIRESSFLEYALRALYCALIDSKYASVTAAGQTASWLIESAKAVLKTRTEVAEVHRRELVHLLASAAELTQKRNAWAHGIWSAGSATYDVAESKRNRVDFKINTATLADLLNAAVALNTTTLEIHSWTYWYLGLGADEHEGRLRWEAARSEMAEFDRQWAATQMRANPPEQNASENPE